ncbi:FtsX-like permease family protein [Thermophagus sp. OGC60D27]|uniref:FtsX-like permease family protein n=1 Tax=Thermophagus sp. OGC60D27 TaxID=3458415 RepID=UPI004037ABB7
MRIWNYIVISFRTLFLHRGFSLLTLVGLSVGIAMSIFVLKYVFYQFSYDRHYEDAENIYRVVSTGKMENEAVNVALTPMVLASRLKEFPEILDMTRVLYAPEKPVRSNYAKAFESEIIYGDSAFFSIFSRPFLLGGTDQWCSDSTGIMISQSVASGLFGSRNPLGEPVWISETDTFRVIGVFQDVPENSHFKFGIVLPFIVLEKQMNAYYGDKNYSEVSKSWFSLITYIYCKIAPETNVQDLTRHINGDIESEMNRQREALFDPLSQTFLSFSFQQLTDIYLFSDCDFEIGETANSLYVFIFLGIAFFILAITAFNFMNLTTSRALDRAMEAIVRRIFGARRHSLVVQFISESVLFSFIALFLGLVLVELLLPFFGKLFNVDFLGSAYREQINIWWVIVITFFVGLLSGVYPASVFSGISAGHLQDEKGRFSSYPGLWLRGPLVFLQVFVAVMLCTISIGMWRQMHYVRNYDLGFNSENLILVEGARYLGEDIDSVISQIRNIEGITHVSKLYDNPGDPVPIMSFNLSGDSSRKYLLSVHFVDCTFFETLQAVIKEGNVFCADSSKVLVNEEGASLLGVDEGEEKILQAEIPGFRGKTDLHVSGVVKNLYLSSLKDPLRPSLFIAVKKHDVPGSILIRYSGTESRHAFNQIKKVWDGVGTSAPFTAVPLLEKVNSFYSEDYRYSSLATAFAVLVVIMASLGMTGLVSFLISTRRDDFFLRRIMGFSDVNNGITLFSGYFWFVLAGVILSLMLSRSLLNFWMQTFSAHSTVNYLCFFIPAVLLLGLGFGIAWYGTIRLRRQMSLHRF